MKGYPGLLVYVVGPSGSGKDSLMQAAQSYFSTAKAPLPFSAVHFAQRYITRPAEAGHEQHLAISPQDFSLRSQRGDFVMEWHRHGLAYGISREILPLLEQGCMVVMNGSREYAPQAIASISPLLLVEVRVRPEILRQRLELRGREDRQSIEARLGQAAVALPPFPHHVCIDNSGSLEAAQQAFIGLLANSPDVPAQSQ